MEAQVTNTVTSLTKNSNKEEVKRYFLKILELKKSNEEFPVDLEEVWALVYTRKDTAVKELCKNFIQNIDYQVFRQKAERSYSQTKGGGHNKTTYKLSVSCLEFFIARKVRAVFDVYRNVFHQAIEQKPLSPAEQLLHNAQILVNHEKQLKEHYNEIETIKQKQEKLEKQISEDLVNEKVKRRLAQRELALWWNRTDVEDLYK